MSHGLTATAAPQERHIGNYQLLRNLGQGSFGKVWLGWHNPTGTAVAVKAIRGRQGRSGLRRRLPQEAECMAVLHHPHIVQLFEVIVTKDVLYLIMENVSGGDLRGYLQLHGTLSEDEARGIFRQLVPAVRHMHRKGVIHRDLKPSNVLLEAGMRVKVADFGLSAFFHRRKLSAFCGSPFYAAPEVFRARAYDGPPADVWSLGVLLYTMVTGHVPFEEEDLRELKKAVLSGKYTMPLHVSFQLQNLLTRLLTVNPKERSSLEFLMSSLGLATDDEEQSNETPPREDLEPWVTQEMVDMGFQRDQIARAVKNKTYDYVMGTYLLLNTKEPKAQYHTTRVEPFTPPDLGTNEVPTQAVRPECSRPQQTEQQHKSRRSGKEAVEFAGPAASPTSRTDTPGPRPESRNPKPGPRLKSKSATPGPSVESGTPSPGPSGKSTTPTPGPSLKTDRAKPAPSPKWRKVSPRHSPKSRTAIPRPSPKSRTPSPRLRPKTKTATPLPIRESQWSTATPPLIPELGSGSSIPPLFSELELGTATSPLIQESESRATTPPLTPELESGSATPALLSGLELETATPQLVQESESRPTTPPPVRELASWSAIPPLVPESESRTAPSIPSPESNAATPSPGPQPGPGVAPSSPSGGSSGHQERNGQGRRGLARRCWHFFKKLCLGPCQKGRGRRNKVMPL